MDNKLQYKVVLTQQTFPHSVTLKPGTAKKPGADLTPGAKVLFDEIVSNFEDWLHDNSLEAWEIATAAQAAQAYMVERAEYVQWASSALASGGEDQGEPDA